MSDKSTPLKAFGVDTELSKEDTFELEYIDHILAIHIRKKCGEAITVRRFVEHSFYDTVEFDEKVLTRPIRELMVRRLADRNMSTSHISRFLGIEIQTVCVILRSKTPK